MFMNELFKIDGKTFEEIDTEMKLMLEMVQENTKNMIDVLLKHDITHQNDSSDFDKILKEKLEKQNRLVNDANNCIKDIKTTNLNECNLIASSYDNVCYLYLHPKTQVYFMYNNKNKAYCALSLNDKNLALEHFKGIVGSILTNLHV